MTRSEAIEIYNRRIDQLKEDYAINSDDEDIKMTQPSTINWDPIYARYYYNLSERTFLYTVKHYEETVMLEMAIENLHED